MDIVEASKRDFTIKTKRLRRAGMVPGSVYGGALKESIPLQMNERMARKAAAMLVGAKLTLDLEGERLPVQLKEKHIDPLSNQITSLSFQALEADRRVNSVLHIIVKNGQKVTSALLEQLVLEIPYSALPEDMLDTVAIDVEGMAVGTVIRVSDIKELDRDRLHLQIDPNEAVLRIREAVQQPDEAAAAL